MSGVNKVKSFLAIVLGISLLASSVISVAGVVVEIQGDVATATADGSRLSASDYANATHMPIPQSTLAPSNAGIPADFPGEAGFAPGGSGTGKVRDKSVPPVNETLDEVGSAEFGALNHPFNTNRVDIQGLNKRLSNRPYYRESGKLFFKIGASTFVCSASLIKPGVIVTAAHCVSQFGGPFHSNWEYHPGRYGNKNLGGIQVGVQAWVMASYFNGTEVCAVAGVICPNDVAVIRLAPESGNLYIGHFLGYYGYAWNGWGFTTTTPFAAGLLATHVTSLGYPVSHDGGNYMQRNGSLGYTDAGLSNNTIIGSRMTGGASGGPWINNHGELANLSGTGVGSFASRNIVVGTTSWQYTDTTLKQLGASPFTSGNITVLVAAVCPVGTEAWCQ